MGHGRRIEVPMQIHLGLLAAIFLAAMSSTHAAETHPPDRQAFLDIYRELVEINTTDSVGDTVRAAQAMAARLRDGGLPAQDVQVLRW